MVQKTGGKETKGGRKPKKQGLQKRDKKQGTNTMKREKGQKERDRLRGREIFA